MNVVSDPDTCSVLRDANSCEAPPTGLPAEPLPAAEVERPAAGLQGVPRRLPGPGPLHAGLHLEARPVLRQREGRQLPRGHHGQQAAAYLPGRQRSVQHQVVRPSVCPSVRPSRVSAGHEVTDRQDVFP